MKKQLIINSLVVLFTLSPLAYLFFTWQSIPDTFVTRFKFSTTIEDEGGKEALLIATFVISLAPSLLYIALRNLKSIDPMVNDATPKSSFNKLGTALAIFLTIANFLFVVSVKNNSVISVNTVFVGVGFLIALAGNYMNNIKPNYVAGFRVSWTLNDPDNWRKTHHLASKVWFAGGVLLIVISFALPSQIIVPMLILVMLILIIVPCVYSYRIHKSKSHNLN
ncbi:MAG: SdpI family protein [Bacteroidota bacterium]